MHMGTKLFLMHRVLSITTNHCQVLKQPKNTFLLMIPLNPHCCTLHITLFMTTLVLFGCLFKVMTMAPMACSPLRDFPLHIGGCISTLRQMQQGNKKYLFCDHWVNNISEKVLYGAVTLQYHLDDILLKKAPCHDECSYLTFPSLPFQLSVVDVEC